jgi:predicted nucleotidyltransferase component of viral defense system
MFSVKYLENLSDRTGYNARSLQKQMVLLNLLKELSGHPKLRRAYALKGGTALNIFWLDFPRLSVDLDFNYIGSPDLSAMREERDDLEKQIRRVIESTGITVDHIAKYHAGGKWRLRAPSAFGGNISLELDLNYLMRVPVWNVVEKDAYVLDDDFKVKYITVDIHELYAGKIKALLDRSAARDLFDVHYLAMNPDIVTIDKLRKNVILFGITSNDDWRKKDYRTVDAITEKRVTIELRDLVITELNVQNMKKTVISYLDNLLNYSAGEKSFMDKFLDEGIYEPKLLFNDNARAEKLKNHPAVLWKLKNLREHKGLSKE